VRSLLIRCYPARWRARYSDEFAAILEESPLGPFDAMDILLGALDAHLRLRRADADIRPRQGISMSLRIGGFAAILGGAVYGISVVLGIGLGANINPLIPGILLATASATLVVALAGLSAFQARTHPVLSWAAMVVTVVAALVCVVGIVGLQMVGEGFWDAFTLGIVGALMGSTLFAIATYRTAALSHGAALLLGAGAVMTMAAGLGGDRLGPVPLVVASTVFAMGWFMLGIDALRLDRPANQPRPA
jgi:hypothetical protein